MIIQEMKMKKANAYLTVEAALVMPVVLGAVLLVVYLLFFQYNRCLMEQNTGMQAMRGCTLQVKDGKLLVARIMEQAEEVDQRFLAWSLEKAKIRLQGNYVQVDRSGMLKFPFRGVMFWKGDREWQSIASFKNYRIRPVDFIRNCRKIRGGK